MTHMDGKLIIFLKPFYSNIFLKAFHWVRFNWLDCRFTGRRFSLWMFFLCLETQSVTAGRLSQFIGFYHSCFLAIINAVLFTREFRFESN